MRLLKKEWLFFSFLSLFFILSFKLKPSFKDLYLAIDFKTIRALTALLFITTAVKISGMFKYFSTQIVKKLSDERNLALVLVIISTFLSMFLTNDITLFIIVPLTLSISSQIKNNLTKLIVFETMAVNVGSMLTPFGNPQNIYLFRQMDISVVDFILKMGIVFLPLFLLLVAYTYVLFPKKQIFLNPVKKESFDKKLFFISWVMFFIFIVSLEFSILRYTLILIISVYFFICKRVFKEFDYFLILTFVLMFIDFDLLSRLETIQNLMKSFSYNYLNIFNLSVFLSQLFSNVPAAIFITKFTHDYLPVAYGVNIAANGFFIASLANIIAIRFAKNSVLEFHKYSIPYFLFSYVISLVLLWFL